MMDYDQSLADAIRGVLEQEDGNYLLFREMAQHRFDLDRKILQIEDRLFDLEINMMNAQRAIESQWTALAVTVLVMFVWLVIVTWG